MKDVIYLSGRYLLHHRVKTLILVASVTLIVYLPIGLRVLVGQSATALRARAESTPLLVGAKGSPLELVLNSLYLESDTPNSMDYGEALRIESSSLARAIPLHTGFRAHSQPIVGTSLDYFEFRELTVAEGRPFALLGECVVGAKAAEALGVAPGDQVMSSPETVFDLTGVYPLRMRVVGRLTSSNGPDDEAIFVDVRTAWVIAGLAHGHQDMTQPRAAPGILRTEGNRVIANASVVQYNEITPENIDSFHFHGDPETFPITAVIAVPHSEKAATRLRGRYLGEDELVQIVDPKVVMEELLSTILTVQTYLVAAVVIVSLSTLATGALVFLLSIRLRQREIETMHRIGGSRWIVGTVLASEIVAVVLTGVFLATILSWITSQFGASAIRLLLT